MLIDFSRKIIKGFSSWINQFFDSSASTRNPDLETLSLLNDPEFIWILEQAKEQKEKGGFSEKELRRLLEIESAQNV